tara:strand:- start:9820 stop:10293 length:474 start_codon:yes stop_codon:yes gene_type:complete
LIKETIRKMRYLKNNLLVLTDDDPDDCEFFLDTIETINIDIPIQVFNGGDQLMEYLTNINSKLPDIIFLDLNMPVKNGFECLKEIRSNERLKKICTIIFSTSYNNSDIELSYKLGANAYIQKPFNREEMQNILKNTLDTDWNDPCSALDKHNFVLHA